MLRRTIGVCSRRRNRPGLGAADGYNGRTGAIPAPESLRIQVRLPRPNATAAFAGVVAFCLLALSACGGNGVTSGGGPGPTPLPPRITTITPDAGTIAGGTLVTLTGVNFASGATVTIAGAPATSVTYQSPTTLTALTGPRAAGTGDVVVTAPGGTATCRRGSPTPSPGRPTTLRPSSRN